MQEQTAILIIGGGLAGLTTALHLQKAGIETILIEKLAYPHHKVCGEYLSNEVLPYLQWLGVDPLVLGATRLSKLHFTTSSGREIGTTLPLGGLGVSRYALDHMLFNTYLLRGGCVIQDTVTGVSFDSNTFVVSTQQERRIKALHVVGAYGKRSALDSGLQRRHAARRSPFLAVKAHYQGDYPDHLISLHNFRGGYCGVSKVENNKINICYLADYKTFKPYKSTSIYQKEVVCGNRHLQALFDTLHPLFDAPLTISQLDFGPREIVSNHILMVGDTAGLIHPLCGNGMSMAIHAAKICAELLTASINCSPSGRAALERTFTQSWKHEFSFRLKMGTALSSLLRRERLSELVLGGMSYVPSLLPSIIRKTHGKSLTVTTAC